MNPDNKKKEEQIIKEWAKRHDIQGTLTDLICMFEDARTLELSSAAPATASAGGESDWNDILHLKYGYENAEDVCRELRERSDLVNASISERHALQSRLSGLEEALRKIINETKPITMDGGWFHESARIRDIHALALLATASPAGGEREESFDQFFQIAEQSESYWIEMIDLVNSTNPSNLAKTIADIFMARTSCWRSRLSGSVSSNKAGGAATGETKA